MAFLLITWSLLLLLSLLNSLLLSSVLFFVVVVVRVQRIVVFHFVFYVLYVFDVVGNCMLPLHEALDDSSSLHCVSWIID